MEKEPAKTTCPSTEHNTGCFGPEIGCLVFPLLLPLWYVYDSWVRPQGDFLNWFLKNFVGLIFLTIVACIYYAIRALINRIKTKINNKRGK